MTICVSLTRIIDNSLARPLEYMCYPFTAGYRDDDSRNQAAHNS